MYRCFWKKFGKKNFFVFFQASTNCLKLFLATLKFCCPNDFCLAGQYFVQIQSLSRNTEQDLCTYILATFKIVVPYKLCFWLFNKFFLISKENYFAWLNHQFGNHILHFRYFNRNLCDKLGNNKKYKDNKNLICLYVATITCTTEKRTDK